MESRLNLAITNIDEEPFNLDTFLDDTKFRFRLFDTSGEYEKASKNGNEVTYYINGVMRLVGSDKEGTVNENYSASISAVLDLVVPRCDLYKESEDGRQYGIYNAVEYIVDEALRLAEVDTMTLPDEQGNDINYFVSTQYQISIAGVRDIRGQVGDSLPMTVRIDYGIVADGVASSDVIYEIFNEDSGAYERFYPTTVGIARTAIQEGNITSDEEYGVSRSTTNGTTLVLSVARTVRYSYLDKLITRFALGAVIEPFKVRIQYPIERVENGLVYESYIYPSMVFAQVGINGLDGTAMSSECRIVQEIED